MPRNSSTSTSSWILATAAIALAALGGLNYWVDPFQQYRRMTAFAPRFWHPLQRYIVPGFAKRGDYSVVLLGSSMFETFSNSEASQLLGGKATNLTLSAISAFEEGRMVDLAFRYAPVKRVVLDMNVNSFAGPPDKRWVSDPLPEYLWDANPFNDVRYLLSSDTLDRSLDILQNRRGGPDWYADADMPWAWARKVEFSRKHVVAGLDPQNLNARFNQPQRTVEEMMTNFDVNILPHIQRHPEARFDLIHAPYSVLVWIDFAQRKQVDVTLDFKRKLFEKTRGLANVVIHDFQIAPVTEDLDQYTDLYHFGLPVASWMLHQISKETYRVTDANIASTLESQRIRANTADPRKWIN
jgi:hypothetical protein